MPKLSKSLTDAINAQIQDEIGSAYLYLDMSTQCASQNLPGAANWLSKQWDEELSHARKLMAYVVERGNEVKLKGIAAPGFTFKSLKQTFQETLKHEQAVTASINKLYATAAAENDYAAQAFLQWFVTEQIEEENSAQGVLDMIEIAGDTGTAVLMVDKRLAIRE